MDHIPAVNTLVAGYTVSTDGTAVELDWPLKGLRDPGDGYHWVHLAHGTSEGDQWLREESGIPDHAVEALLDPETRPRCEKFDSGVLLFLRGVNLNPEAAPEDMVSIRLWVEPHRIVSVRIRRLMAVADLRELMEANRAPETTGAFLVDLCEKLSTRIESVILQDSDLLDQIEEEILDEDVSNKRAKTSGLRRRLIALRRYLSPQRDALSRLAEADDEILTKIQRIEFREIHNATTRMIEALDSMRERTTVISEQLMDMRAEEMNRNMMVLSVVAAIFLPLGFLTGLLGINVGGMPGADNEMAFWVVCGLLALLTAALLILFRRLKWL